MRIHTSRIWLWFRNNYLILRTRGVSSHHICAGTVGMCIIGDPRERRFHQNPANTIWVCGDTCRCAAIHGKTWGNASKRSRWNRYQCFVQSWGGKGCFERVRNRSQTYWRRIENAIFLLDIWGSMIIRIVCIHLLIECIQTRIFCLHLSKHRYKLWNE